jgi:uncharacterized protein YjbI with pentapeptide repeats
MADSEHIKILKQGVDAWNRWRDENPKVRPDLSYADLSKEQLPNVDFQGADLTEAQLSYADLSGAKLHLAKLRGAWVFYAKLVGAKLPGADLSQAGLNESQLSRADLLGAKLNNAFVQRAELREANLYGAELTSADMSSSDLTEANLTDAHLDGAKLHGADLTRARLEGTNLSGADFSEATLYRAVLKEATLFKTRFFRADLSGADLSNATLRQANLIEARLTETNLDEAKLDTCYVYGISAWGLRISEKTEQSNLVINPGWANQFVTVEDIEVAQFIYLLLDNRKLRSVIDTMTSKAVLILGNFARERKQVLDALKERLRERGYLPIMFDFEGPQNRNLIDTVTTVTRLSRYVIVDITQPRSVPAELEAIVPALPSLPVQPLIEGSEEPYAMFRDLVERDSVLKLHRYRDLQDLLASLDEAIITPAETKLKDLEIARLRALEKL